MSEELMDTEALERAESHPDVAAARDKVAEAQARVKAHRRGSKKHSKALNDEHAAWREVRAHYMRAMEGR